MEESLFPRTIIGIVKVEHMREKMILGAVTMGVGFFGLIISLYYWYQGTNVVYLLGPLARYVAGIGGMVSLVIGTNLVSEALLMKKMSRGGYELRTKMGDLEKRLGSRKPDSEASLSSASDL